jgi:cytochrome b6-f complex iron-sulfur subunit
MASDELLNVFITMDRRKFLKTSCAICGIAAIGATVFLESCKKEKKQEEEPQVGTPVNFTLDLTKPENAALNTPGGSVVSNGIVIIALASSFTALSQTCTHQGCKVNYDDSSNNLVCPCHGGTYNIDGKVIAGPPPAPLKKYTVTKNGDILTIKA